jgi:hypothetical protein
MKRERQEEEAEDMMLPALDVIGTDDMPETGDAPREEFEHDQLEDEPLVESEKQRKKDAKKARRKEENAERKKAKRERPE